MRRRRAFGLWAGGDGLKRSGSVLRDEMLMKRIAIVALCLVDGECVVRSNAMVWRWRLGLGVSDSIVSAEVAQHQRLFSRGTIPCLQPKLRPTQYYYFTGVQHELCCISCCIRSLADIAEESMGDPML